MARIVIDARELRTSSGRYVERLLHYLQDVPTEHEFIALMKPEDVAGWRSKSEHFRAVACIYKEFTFAEQLQLLRQIRSLKPDLVHFAFPQQPVLYRGKTVTTIHDLTTLRFDNPSKNRVVFKVKQRVYGWVVKQAVKKASAVIAISEFVRQDVLHYTHVDASKVTRIYESADHIDEPPTPLPDLQNKQFIMYVGRPTPHKNLERLIKAFELLRAQHPSLHLVLAGKKDDNYRRIEANVQQKGRKNIVFTDFVTESQLRWLYENCQAYIFPSLSEGFGLPGLEAMRHGAPVVSSDATCLPEVYGDAARYFDPLDVQAIADAINEVLTNKELRMQLTSKGHEQAKKYSWSHMAEETLAVYEQVLKASRQWRLAARTAAGAARADSSRTDPSPRGRHRVASRW